MVYTLTTHTSLVLIKNSNRPLARQSIINTLDRLIGDPWVVYLSWFSTLDGWMDGWMGVRRTVYDVHKYAFKGVKSKDTYFKYWHVYFISSRDIGIVYTHAWIGSGAWKFRWYPEFELTSIGLKSCWQPGDYHGTQVDKQISNTRTSSHQGYPRIFNPAGIRRGVFDDYSSHQIISWSVGLIVKD